MGEKSFLKHFAIIGGGTFLNLLLGLFTTPLITRIVDPIEYGQHSIFLLYANLAILILLLGMDQGLVRYYYLKPEKEYKRALLFRCIKYPVIITFFAAAAVMICSIRGSVNFEFSTPIMALLCLYTFFEVIFRFGLNVIRLEYNSKLYSTLNIVLKLGFVCIALPLLFFADNEDLLMLCIASTGSAVIVTLFSIFSKREMWRFRSVKASDCNVNRIELMKYALPLTVTMGITYLFQALDRLSIQYFCDYSEVGIYASTMSLVNVFAIIQTTFNTLWSPMAIEHYSKDPEDRTFYQKGNQIITVIMFFLGVSLILCKDIFALLLGEKYRAAAYILPFLIFHPIMYTISETTVTGINFMKKSNMTVIIAGISCFANFVGNTILVPRIGGRGAAISTGLSYILFFALRTLISNHYYYVDFKLKKFAILTICVCGYALYNTFFAFNWVSLVGYCVCVLLILILYKDTVIWGIKYFFKELRSLRNKG